MGGPRLAVDCVISDDAGRIVLIRRKNEPFAGEYALPGGFVELGERVEDACRREVKEETNLHLDQVTLVGVYSDPARDPRGHIVSIAFAAHANLAEMKGGDDAAQAEAVSDWSDHSIAFDHRRIIEDACRLSSISEKGKPVF